MSEKEIGAKTSAIVVVSEDVFGRFIDFIDAAPKTVETYRYAVRQFLIWLRRHDIVAPDRRHVVAYRDEIKERLKPASVQNYVTAIKIFFKWTEQEGIYQNIAENLKGAKVDRTHKKDALTSKQVKEILDTIRGDDPDFHKNLKGLRDYAIIALAATSGLRTVEIARAQIGDIRTIADQAVLFIQGKGHEEKSDYVKLAAPVEKAIRDYLKRRGDVGGQAVLFASVSERNYGKNMTTRSVSRIVKSAFQNAGYDSERLTAHSLRHTAATLNLLNGATLEETQQLLRHGSINTTMIYNHALDRMKNMSEDRVSRAIFN